MAKYTLENSFDIDTKELYACGVEFSRICSAIEEDINDMFDKLANIEKTCWVGKGASAYAEKSKIEKIEYIKFNNALKEYGKCLCSIAEEYDSFATKVGVE